MWKFVGDEKGLEPIPGIPTEASDEEFEAAVKKYEARYGREGKGSIERSGLYRRYGPKPEGDKKEEG